MSADEKPSLLKAMIPAFAPRIRKISLRRAFTYFATHIAIPVVVAYLAAVIAIKQHTTAQYESEAHFVSQLTLAARFEAEENANDIRRWQRSLLVVAQELEDFINHQKSSRPGINPGYSRFRTRALGALVQSPIATRHMKPCVISTLAQVHTRLTEANHVNTATDAALVQYTATYTQTLQESYTAAARLHAHIEQLLNIYAGLPDYLHLVADHEPWPCVADYEAEKSSHITQTVPNND